VIQKAGVREAIPGHADPRARERDMRAALAKMTGSDVPPTMMIRVERRGLKAWRG